MSRFTVPALLAAAALAVGCAGRGYYATDSYGYATYATPDLAYVSPGVSVVTGYDYPVFYSNNYYWRYDSGRWFRSPYYDRGWSYYARPPQVIARIDSPYRYRNYRPSYTVRRDRGYQRPVYRDRRDYRSTRPVYRDGRTYDRRGGYYRDGRYYDRDGRIRDHRR